MPTRTTPKDCPDPAFRAQLQGGPTQGEDCGVVATIIALDFVTCGQVDKGVKQIRNVMGVPSGATRTADQESALRELALGEARLARLERDGLRPPRIRRRVLVPFGEAREALRAGRGLVIPVSYAVVNRRRPDLSGDRGFMGYHSIFAAAIREDGEGREWLIHDPLYNVPGDPRRPVPTGPRWWPEWLVRRAAGRMRVVLGHDPQGDEIRGEVGQGRIIFVEATRPRLRRPDKPDTDDDIDDLDDDLEVQGAGRAGGSRGAGRRVTEPSEPAPGPAAPAPIDPPGDGAAELLAGRAAETAMELAGDLARLQRRVQRLRAEIEALEAENAAAEARIEELEGAVEGVAAVLAAVGDGAAAEAAE